MVVMQLGRAAADLGSVVSHCATLCTRVPTGMSAAGTAALHGTNAPSHGSAVVRCVSYIGGDGAVAVYVEEKLVTRFRPVVPRVLVVVVMLVLFVSRCVHKSAEFRS